MNKTRTLPFGLVALVSLAMLSTANAVEVDSFDWRANYFANMWEDVSPIGTFKCDGSYATRTHEIDPTESYYIRVIPNHPSIPSMALVNLGETPDELNFDGEGGWNLLMRARLTDVSGTGAAGVTANSLSIFGHKDNRTIGGSVDWRMPGLFATNNKLYRHGSDIWSAVEIGDFNSLDGKFHDYVLQYNATTDEYEYLVDNVMIDHHARNLVHQPTTYLNAGMSMGRRIPGNSTVEWDVSRMAFGPGVFGPGNNNADTTEGSLVGPWRLFVDDSIVAQKSNVTRTYHAFAKNQANPVLVADTSSEGATAYVYGTVLPQEDGTGYRMWYQGYGGHYTNCYAESDDGINWTKPNLGLFEHNGSTENNIFLFRTTEDHTPQVIYTPWESDPSRRYKLINFDYGRTPPDNMVRGYYGATSSDGIHWTDVPDNPMLTDYGDVGNFVWDPNTSQYIGYPKKAVDVRGFSRRCVAYTESGDFSNWTTPSLILVPDEIDDNWVTQAGQRTDFYGLSAFPYESGYLGFLWIFRHTDGGNDGPIWCELVSSPDGVNWIRQDPEANGQRMPILPLGPDGSWDDGMIFTTNQPIVEGDTIKQWYGGFNGTHGESGRYGSVGLATLRKDGFASLDASAAGGDVTTIPIECTGDRLAINALTNPGGSVQVELLDANGQPIAGFSLSDPFVGDEVSYLMTFNGSKDIKSLLGENVKLQFHISDAALYSFAFLKSEGFGQIPGDANKDGVVDEEDATLLAMNWQTASGATWGDGDFNDDGKANDADATILAANWYKTAASNATVPEPGALVVLTGVMLMVSWRIGMGRTLSFGPSSHGCSQVEGD